MKRYRQFQPLAISQFETERWTHPEHGHNHYEFIYIQHGSGTHHVNGSQLSFHRGDVFLVGPDEAHYFDIAELTGFVFIKFTDPYTYSDLISFDQFRYLEYLIKSRETHLSVFRLNEQDELTARLLFEIIISLKTDLPGNERLIWLQLLALAELLQRNMPEFKTTNSRTRDMQAMFCYIHKFIYFPDKLKARVMAAHFNTTADYIGPYFKRNAGITLREYIGDYRRTLLVKRIDGSKHSLKQIAAEFGLTDESHVSKLIRGPGEGREKAKKLITG